MAVKQGDFFDDLETMSPEIRSEFLNLKLSQQLLNAYRHSPAAKIIFDRAGITPDDINSIADLIKLPIIRKTDIIEWQKSVPPYGGLLTILPEEAERVFISPGPIYEPHQTAKIQWFAKAFYAAGFRKGDVVLNAFTYHMSPAGILMHESMRFCGAVVIPMGTGNTDIQIQTMRDLKVTGFIGTPSFLHSLIKRAEEMGLNLKRDFTLKRTWFTGEMLSPTLRKTFEGDYGLATAQAYAVTEPGGAIAYECIAKDGMHFMDDYVIEIADPVTGKQLGPGEIGEIVVTPIHNPIWGLIRFGTGDLSSYIAEPCSCGRTSYRLTGILGRTGDAVKVRGMFIVAKQVEQVVAGFEQIARFQVVVTRKQERDELTLKAELKPDTELTGDELAAGLNQKFQDVCRLKLDRIEFMANAHFPEKHPLIIDERVWK